MKTEALFLFLILLIGLILASFLGTNEGYSNLYNYVSGSNSSSNSGSSDTSDSDNTSSSNNTTNSSNNTTNSDNSSTSTSSTNYDNYNHYSGTTSSSLTLQNGLVFTDAVGDTLTVSTGSNGLQTLALSQPGNSATMVLNQNSTNANMFNAPFGNVNATVITDSNNQTSIQINLPNGETIIFSQPNATAATTTAATTTATTTAATTTAATTTGTPATVNSTQYYGSTGTSIPQTNYNYAYQSASPYPQTAATPYYGPNSGTPVAGPYGANPVTGPAGPYGAGSTGPYDTTPVAGANPVAGPYGPYGAGSTPVAGANPVAGPAGPYGAGGPDYYSTLPPGIPKSQIPPGQEDSYILKSQIVPPVCPACSMTSSDMAAMHRKRKEQCPPCPACARCPEPSFECKKVPNYSSIDEESLPMPVLADFSQFGM